jgi:hypothetical protein
MVTSIGRFGAKLNLNVHLHTLVLDAGYSFKLGKARFYHAGGPHQRNLKPCGARALGVSLTRWCVPVCWRRKSAGLCGFGDGLALRATGWRGDAMR